MAVIYQFITFLSILLFCVKLLKIFSVERVSEVSQKTNVKLVIYVERKTWSKGKPNENEIGEIIAIERTSKNFTNALEFRQQKPTL